MAENDDEALLEEESSAPEESEVTPNDEDGTKKKKGLSLPISLSKPLLIKIAIGVTVVLILAGAAYFFLAPSDEELSAEEAALVDEEASDLEKMSDEQDATIELPGLPEDAAVEDGEQVETNIELPDLLGDETAESSDAVEGALASDAIEDALASDAANLEPALNQLDVPKIDEQTAAEAAVQLAEQQKIEAEALAAQIKAERYNNIFEEGARPYPWTRKSKSQPTPEPKWGEFERAE